MSGSSELGGDALVEGHAMRTLANDQRVEQDFLSSVAVMEPESETVVVQSLDELLTWPPRPDPWHQMCSLEHDCVMVVEFSEINGPQPVLVVPPNPGAHFDPTDFALWLLTANYQQTGRGNSFSLPDDIQMMVENEEQGIQTYAHHFILFDIQARGFVRPFCFAYLSNDCNKVPRLFAKLKDIVSEELTRIKNCNRRLFKRQLYQTIDALAEVRNRDVSSIYKVCFNNTPPNGHSKKLADQNNGARTRTRKLLSELEAAYQTLETDKLGGAPCGAHDVDIDTWLDQLIQHKSLDDCSKSPVDLELLCPCVFSEFYRKLRQIWSDFRHDYPFIRFLTQDPVPGPLLHLHTFPLLQLPQSNSSPHRCLRRTNSKDDEPTASDAAYLDGSYENQNGDEQNRLLVSVVPSLSQLLYPLLTGQFMLVVGAQMRRPTLLNLVGKLRRFVPCPPPSATSLCTRWHDGRVPPTAFADYKLFGLHLPAGVQLSERVASNVLPFLSVLDLNTDVFHSSHYKGRILDKVSTKTRLFGTDRSLVLYLYSLIGEYALLAYVSYYFVYSSCETYRRNAKHLQRLAQFLSLSAGDMKIIRYLVELIKQQQLDQPRFESPFENIFLEYEPSQRPLKLK